MRGADRRVEIETVRCGAVLVSDLRFAVCVLIFVRAVDLDDLSLPSVNFWLVQVAAICAAAAAGLAVMPVSAAPGLALAALIAFIAAFSGWVRTFHKFGL